jgi:hypothetical protein
MAAADFRTECVLRKSVRNAPGSTKVNFGEGVADQAAAAPRESRIPVGKASLYSREIGRGQPIIVLHGGPDFDHGYLLPDLDRLADAFRLPERDIARNGNCLTRERPPQTTEEQCTLVNYKGRVSTFARDS